MTNRMKSKQGWANVICEARDEDNRCTPIWNRLILLPESFGSAAARCEAECWQLGTAHQVQNTVYA
jgi:hypothetical protein